MPKSTRPTLRAVALLLCALGAALPAASQPTTPFVSEPEVRGTAYYVFAEPGAPTVEIVVLGTGTANGVYRLQEGTTLVEALALAGGTARSDSTRAGTTTAHVRVIREAGGVYQVIYEATPEDLVQNRARHPRLQTGDTIETTVEFKEADPPGLTLRDGVEIASRVASLISFAILIITRF